MRDVLCPKGSALGLSHHGAQATVVRLLKTSARLPSGWILPQGWAARWPRTLRNEALGEEFAGVADHGRGRPHSGRT